MATKRKTKNGKINLTGVVKVKVVGVGGGGGNAITRMSADFPRGVEFIAINTDIQDLEFCAARRKIHIGKTLTGGLGAGMNPELGARSAEENKPEIAEAIKGADLLFLTAGFGGGTGTGALPVVAEIARESGALTIAVVTKPFAFEGAQRSRIAQDGIAKLKDKVDALIVIPNDRIFSVINKDTPIIKAFSEIDEVLKNAVQGVVDLIVSPGIVNVDFADMKTIINGAGSAIVGVGVGSGQERCVDAVRQALNSPLLEVTPEGAKGVLFGVSGGRDMKMTEINEAAKVISEAVDPSAKIIFGAYQDKKLKQGQVKVTLIATGFSESRPAIGSLFSQGGSNPLLKKQPLVNQEENIRKSNTISLISEAVNGEKKINGVTSKPKNNGNSEQESEKADSIWDIPTFLRKRIRKGK